MSEQTKIEWCDSTWNPWRGCQAVSTGCKNCYAKALVNGRMGGDFSMRVRAAAPTFNAPLRWNKHPLTCDCGSVQIAAEDVRTSACPKCRSGYRHRRVFLGSLMDIFDPAVPPDWFADVLDIVRRCPDLDFLMVTKRPELFLARLHGAFCRSIPLSEQSFWLRQWFDEGIAPKNVWVITSVEDQAQSARRIPHLLNIPAVVRGLSVEPLLEPIKLQCLDEQLCDVGEAHPKQLKFVRGIHWVIVGGESGPHRRDCGVEAIVNIAMQCQCAEVPCFVKQDSAACPGQQGRIPDHWWEVKQFPEPPPPW